MSFAGKVVLVTGASSGIGAATALQFASEGASLAIVGRNTTKLSNITAKCKEHGSDTIAINADLNREEDIKRIISETISHFGKLDVLVNNAGIYEVASITGSNALEMFDKIMLTNLRAVVLLTHLAVPYLIESKGNIVNVSSVCSTNALHHGFAYCTSKAGMDHFGRCIAFELGPKGVRVNNVNPGPVKTDLLENIGLNEEQRAKAYEEMKVQTVLDRIGQSEEVADLVVFLASDKARSITGAAYLTDNGVSLKM